MMRLAPTLIFTDEVDAVASFLASALQLQRHDGASHCTLSIEEGEIIAYVLQPQPPGSPSLGPSHLHLGCDDVAAAAAKALSAGAAFLRAGRYPNGESGENNHTNGTREDSATAGADVAFCDLRSPDGSLIIRLSNYAVLTSREATACLGGESFLPVTEAELLPASVTETQLLPPPRPPPAAAAAAPAAAAAAGRRGGGGDRAPLFRALEVCVLADGGREVPAAPNSRQGIPIDTPYFCGEALLLLRTDPLDPPFSGIFEGKQRQFEIQVQGRFKRVSHGDLYISIEITDRMKLGLVTKGMCKVLLGFAQRLNRFMHYSFGDESNAELPHISFPLVTSVDTLVVTEEGQAPPTLGQRFPEDREDRRRRVSTAGFGDFKVGPIYSFSFHSMYIDIPRWSTRRIPMLRDMDLHAFWGDSAMRVAAYMAPPEFGSKPHLQSAIEYIMCIQVRHDPSVSGDAADFLPFEDEYRDEVETVALAVKIPETAATAERPALRARGSGGAGCPDDVGSAGLSGDDDSDGGESCRENDASEQFADARSQLDLEESHRGLFEPGAFVGGGGGSGGSGSGGRRSSSGVGSSDTEESEEEVARVPAYLELYEGGSSGRRSSFSGDGGGHGGAAAAAMAAAAVAAGVKRPHPTVFVVVFRGTVALRRSKDFERTLPLHMVPPASQFSPRLSAREVQRRRFSTVLQLVSTVHRQSNERILDEFMRAESQADRDFAAGSAADVDVTGGGGSSGGGGGNGGNGGNGGGFDGGDITVGSPGGSAGSGDTRSGRHGSRGSLKLPAALKEGLVVRALSEHHWREEMAVLTATALTLLRGKKVQARIFCGDIIAACVTGSAGFGDNLSGGGSSGAAPLPGFSMVEVHTVGRVHYLMVAGGVQRAREWATALQRLMPAASSTNGGGSGGGAFSSAWRTADDLDDTDAGGGPRPYDQYLAKKSCWKGSARWVLNCRQMSIGAMAARWGGDGGGDGGGDAWGAGPPERAEEVVAALLQQGLSLADEGASRASDLVSFLDGTTRLRLLNLEGLTHAEQVALFLNLYHLMIFHAYLVLGPPASPLRWASYFNNVSYECGGDVLSLAELEHCVIRARMSPPRQFLSKFALPTGEYSFALRRPEPRFNFTLNCGTASGVPGIVVYHSEAIDKQLAEMSAYFLMHTVEVSSARRLATLPKILSWYAGDFGGAPVDVLRAVASNADKATRECLGSMLGEPEGGVVTVRYRGFNWRCRRIELLDPAALVGLPG